MQLRLPVATTVPPSHPVDPESHGLSFQHSDLLPGDGGGSFPRAEASPAPSRSPLFPACHNPAGTADSS